MKLASWLADTDTPDAMFAQAIGVTRQSLWRYKDGSRIPRLSILARIQTATGGAVTANDFMPSTPSQAEQAA